MNINETVENLLQSYKEKDNITKIDTHPQLDKFLINEIINKLQDILFPGYFRRTDLKSDVLKYYVGDQIQDIYNSLKDQIIIALYYQEDDKCYIEKESLARSITSDFINKLPEIRSMLSKDAIATFDGDPAAYSISEIVLSYPGYYAIMIHRLAHELYKLNVPLIPRMMSERAHSLTGIDIHPGATIDEYFMIDHGTGIVIGETTEIGKNVKIYQGVTLGALSTKGGQDLKNKKRHPTIEDDVTIYSNASILGGNTIIGKGATIGGGTFITESVPENTSVYAVANQKVK